MKMILRHRLSEDAELVLEEHRSDFTVTYLTRERDWDGDNVLGHSWYSNKSELFKSYPEAAACFNKRRDSGNPFLTSLELEDDRRDASK